MRLIKKNRKFIANIKTNVVLKDVESNSKITNFYLYKKLIKKMKFALKNGDFI